MNRNEFNRFIAGIDLPGPGDLEELRELVDLFPWFPAAHLLLLRGLKENSDIRFDAQLKMSALSVNNREVLYHYLFLSQAEAATDLSAGTREVTADLTVSRKIEADSESPREELAADMVVPETPVSAPAAEEEHAVQENEVPTPAVEEEHAVQENEVPAQAGEEEHAVQENEIPAPAVEEEYAVQENEIPAPAVEEEYAVQENEVPAQAGEEEYAVQENEIPAPAGEKEYAVQENEVPAPAVEEEYAVQENEIPAPPAESESVTTVTEESLPVAGDITQPETHETDELQHRTREELIAEIEARLRELEEINYGVMAPEPELQGMTAPLPEPELQGMTAPLPEPELQGMAAPLPEPELQGMAAPLPEPELNAEPETELVAESEFAPEHEYRPESVPESETGPDSAPEPESGYESAAELEYVSKFASEPESESEFPPEPEPELEPEPEPELLELIPEEPDRQEESVSRLSSEDLIDRFIRISPTIERMTPGLTEPVRELSDENTGDEGTFITETLAKIYVNQGYYTKAINIYEKLSLQFPEKSAYFADHIKNIKELIK